MIYDWKAFLLGYAILLVIFAVVKWAQNRFDRWIAKRHKNKRK